MRITRWLPGCMLVLPAFAASWSPWGVQSIRETSISSFGIPPVLGPNGDIYVAGAGAASAATKFDAAGNVVFAVQIPGETDPGGILLGPDGSLYVTGFATPGVFVTTPGAYETTGSGPFLCRLSGVDGTILYCTFIDGPGGLAADQAGNAYVAGGYCSEGNAQGCVEKFNFSGGLVYRTAIQTGYIAGAVADAGGNLYVAGSGIGAGGGSFLQKLDPAGQFLGIVYDAVNQPGWLSIDPDGNPQVMMVAINDHSSARVRRYSSDLSSVLFDTGISNFLPLSMWIDPLGGTLLLGGTDTAGILQIHPTDSCAAQSSAEAYGALPTNSHDVMVRLGGAGQVLQSTFALAGLPPVVLYGAVQTDSASLVFDDYPAGHLAVITLGPAPEIQLGCIANAASFRIGALSPEEIVSLTGSGIGPGEPVTGQPGDDNRFPSELGGTQVTFDGIAAPLLYVSATQINAVTPLALTSSETHVCVAVNGAPTNCMDVPVVAADPGIFLIGAHAAALNQDGTINSETNPAAPGSIVSIFATGLGTITPAPPDGSLIGLPLPTQSLQVQASVPVVNLKLNYTTFDPLPMFYAGPAPYEVEGLTQINVRADGVVCVAASAEAFTAITAYCPPIWIAAAEPSSR